jgi:hypothetical protein
MALLYATFEQFRSSDHGIDISLKNQQVTPLNLLWHGMCDWKRHNLKKGAAKMGWKEVWERYQIAATFAEAGEEKMALNFLEEGSKEESSPGEEEHPAHEEDGGLMSPLPAEG